MPTTTATIKHRTQISGTNNPGIQISKNPWNDSELIAGGSLGGLFARDTGQTDGWGLIDAVASGQVLVSAGAAALPAWSAAPTLTSVALTNFVSIGSSVSTTGLLRLQNAGSGIRGRNFLNSADVAIAIVDTANTVIFGDASFVSQLNGSVVGIAGITSSHPALKRAGTTLEHRLGDDSAYAPVKASTVSSTADIVCGTKVSSYNGVTTAGWGVPAIQKAGRSTAQTSANATVSQYTVGAADGTFIVSANVLVTTATNHNFTVTCAYTDEGNTARTLTLAFTLVAGGTLVTAVANANGTVPYMGVPQHIRCKASTNITIATTGTFTTVTYNVEGLIQQIA